MTDQSERYRAIGKFIESRIDALGLKKGNVAQAADMSGATLREIMRGVARERSGATWARLEATLAMPPQGIERVLTGEWTMDYLSELTADIPRPGTDEAPAWAVRLLEEQRRITHALERLADQLEREAGGPEQN